MSEEFKNRRVSLVSHLLIIVTSCCRTPKCSAVGAQEAKLLLSSTHAKSICC